MADSIIALVENSINILKYVNIDTEKEIKSLQLKLIEMKSFLWNFDVKHHKLGIGNELLRKTRSIIYETEDVIDSYKSNVAKIQSGVFWGVRQMVLNMTTYTEIERVKRRIEEFHTNKARFFTIANDEAAEVMGHPIANDEEAEVMGRPIANDEEADVMGLYREKEAIISRLTNDEPELLLISIVGMGGVGKTTLARTVYNHNHILNHFNFRAWVRVSQDYNVRELLQAIIKCDMIFPEEMKETNDVDLMMMLRMHLRSKRYLLVLDDVWGTKAWDDLNEIFAKNLNGSRIIITTRNEGVVSHAKKAHPSSDPHRLYLLNEENSWVLLSKKVFRGQYCPPDLEKIGRKIVKECKGLPLAINLIAGVLREREKEDDWDQVLSRVNLFRTEYMQRCMDVLTLSYDDLPCSLKSCFLYFAVFSEDSEIPARRLIRLWVGEGLVEQDEKPVEVNANRYLEELIDRNLIQATKLRFDGSVKACRMHHLIRKFCILKAKEENFLEVGGNVNPSSPVKSRRIATNNTLNYISSNTSTSNVRSFLCLDNLGEGLLSSKHWKFLYKGFPLIRVLDLSGVSVDSIPSELDKLIHIRYLRLRSHTARSLPSSVSNLQHLQILEVRAPLIDHLPIRIWKMHQLRHLIFSGQVVLLETGDHDYASSDLKTLMSISPDSCTEHILSRLPNLVKLGICGDLKPHMDGKTFNSISVLNKLRTLKLERDRRSQSLSSLDQVEFPENITKLTLSEIQLSSDPMQKLGKLPNLKVLKLTNGAYVGDTLTCGNGGFPQLKVLKLINLRVKKWDISPESMASLQTVIISRCSNLEGLPSALQNISTLRELELWWPNSLVLSNSRYFEKHIGNNRPKLTIYHSKT